MACNSMYRIESFFKDRDVINHKKLDIDIIKFDNVRIGWKK